MQSFPPTLAFDFMGASQPPTSSYKQSRLSHFENYRNENVSRMLMPQYEWGMMDDPYTPSPDVSVYGKSKDKYLSMPHPNFSMVDRGRHQEVDDFYIACQLHRDQYRDDSGSLHPMDYFKMPDYLYQSPPDPTTRYTKYPDYYVKYKHPIVLPTTLGRSFKGPMLPERALTGVYNRSSDITYKR